MTADDIREASDVGPLNERGGRRSECFKLPNTSSSSAANNDEAYVEITVDVPADSLAVHSVKPSGGGDPEVPEVSLLARILEQQRSTYGSSLIRTASNRIRQVSHELRPAGAGRGSKSAGAHALQGLKFISKSSWNTVERRFDMLAEDGMLPRSHFGRCIGMQGSEEFDRELFDALARRRNITGGSITKLELREFWDQISDNSFDSRLQTFFYMVNKNGDGRVTEEEVKEIIFMSASVNKLSRIQAKAEEYARLVMEVLDPNNLGYIEIYNLETLLLQAPASKAVTQTGNTNIHNLSQMLSQKLKPTKELNLFRSYYQKPLYFVEDNWKRVWVIALWLCICASLFTWKFIQYRRRAVYHVMGYCVCVANGGAETLKFNMALILLPVCRNTITWLRNKTKLGTVVPFDDNLNFHKVISMGIVVGVCLHAISHLTCDFPRLLHASHDAYIPMMQFFGDVKPPNYWWFVKGYEVWTGLVMVIIMIIAFTLASPWFRRSRLSLPRPLNRLMGFNAFWYSHHLFIIVYTLLIVHGIKLYLTHKWYNKTTWMYLAVPVCLYGCERLTRTLRSSVRPVKILKVAVHPGNVLVLHVSKPQGFRYCSGQYMFVNCSAVSPFEWHPFSITSAPSDDYLSFHIRTLGDWTRQLKLVFSSVCQVPTGGKSGLLRADYDHSGGGSNPSIPGVLIDGPYGAPSQDYKKYEVVLLIGLGIGATPFISVVKDIVNNLKQLDDESLLEGGSRDTEMRVSDSNRRGAKSSFKTRRAYLYWVTREAGSFDWFKEVMNEVTESDKKAAVELHNYCTSVHKEGDARSAFIEMLQSLNHAKNGVDAVSGLRVKSHFAFPNWAKVYERLALNHQDQRIGVFYCGAPALNKMLRQHALDFSRKTSTKFDFHSEKF